MSSDIIPARSEAFFIFKTPKKVETFETSYKYYTMYINYLISVGTLSSPLNPHLNHFFGCQPTFSPCPMSAPLNPPLGYIEKILLELCWNAPSKIRYQAPYPGHKNSQKARKIKLSGYFLNRSDVIRTRGLYLPKVAL